MVKSQVSSTHWCTKYSSSSQLQVYKVLPRKSSRPQRGLGLNFSQSSNVWLADGRSSVGGNRKWSDVTTVHIAKSFTEPYDERLQQEVPLSPDQLESVFESLDRDRNGFLTPLEFHTGLGELVGSEIEERANMDGDERVELTEIRFIQILMELGADKLFKEDKPELLAVLEKILSNTLFHLQDSLKERENLERALRRREEDHDRVVRSIYEDMESQLKEEREKRQALDSLKHGDQREQLLQELRTREQELEFTLTKQRELECRMSVLSSEQADFLSETRRLHDSNLQLQDQLDQSREELQKALRKLKQLQSTLAEQQSYKERDMNKHLRDDKDAQQTQKSSKYSSAPPAYYPVCRCTHTVSPWPRSIYPY
ncbi:hypothetical protein DNTS_001444 [Danionella cerebrum]|uniref:EF-hand domain-containing protein n=1 Tax=Danionella cerebrum TaxID=2873325 RepID=A0A553R4C4_9TELE|nr:hypothetical protein DNTS_001444 [Danionella translucida]